MSDLKEPYVVLYHECESGFEYEREGFDIADLGTIPGVGDLIVDPGIPVGRSREIASNHTVYEVTRRYFKPRISENYGARVVLVIRERPGEEAEADILYR